MPDDRADAPAPGPASAADPRRPHLVVVEAYQGFLEHLTDDPRELAGAEGLGLPLDEIAERLGCRVTVLDWSLWYADEARHGAHHRWMPFPAARPLAWDAPPTAQDVVAGPRVERRPVSADDPDNGWPFALGLSPRTFGLLAESDPLMLASFSLDRTLEALHSEDPVDAVLLPMFGGLGYVAQMAAATRAGLDGVAFGVVVTGTSLQRQSANGEGLWTRPAQTRRQMEDLSLGLAGLALCFGPEGEARAVSGRPQGPVRRAPRRVAPDVVNAVAREAEGTGGDGGAPPDGPLRLGLHAPRQAASGALTLLDAVALLHRDGRRLAAPVVATGTDMTFPPNLPRDFRGYWSSRGWVRSLVADGAWAWEADPEGGGLPVRLRPSLFEHLPEVWNDLAEGRAVALSPEAAEGLAPGIDLAGLDPTGLVRLGGDGSASGLADHLLRLEAAGPAAVDAARRGLCAAVAAAHRGPERERLMEGTVAGLAALLRGAARPRLDDAARLLLDRRPGREPPPAPPVRHGGAATLTVAVACYEMGGLVVETVESVWAATRVPDEVILVDDGSHGAATLAAIEGLEREARARELPLTVLRQGNRGLAAARNRALEAARGSFVSFLDGDDLIGPDFYRLALGVLEANPGLGGVGAWAETFGDGVPPGFWNAPQPELPALLGENAVFVPVMSPTALLHDLGGYDGRQRYNYEDWELAIRLLARGWPIVTIPRYLQRYRVRSDSLLRTMSDVQNQVMREEMFAHHRATVEAFGPELAAMTEHRLMRTLGRQAGVAASGVVSAREALGVLRSRAPEELRLAGARLAGRARRLLGRGGSRP